MRVSQADIDGGGGMIEYLLLIGALWLVVSAALLVIRTVSPDTYRRIDKHYNGNPKEGIMTAVGFAALAVIGLAVAFLAMFMNTVMILLVLRWCGVEAEPYSLHINTVLYVLMLIYLAYSHFAEKRSA